MQNTELEIKFLMNKNEADKIRKKILQFPNIINEGMAYEKTTMFDNKEERMQREDARLRVREIKIKKEDTSSKIEFSYKRRIRADGGIKKEEEIENSFVADASSFFKILDKMGYFITTSYERHRETFKANNLKITIDEFPFGYILEIEGEENDINKICNLLNLDIKKSYPLSCDDVYVELCEKNKIKPKDHILFNDFEMPHIK